MSRLEADSLANAFLWAARVVAGVMSGQSLADGALARVPATARPAVQDYVYSSLRAYGRGPFLLARLLAKPLKEREVQALLLVALVRLEQVPEQAYVVVDQAVEAAGTLHGGRFRGLVNAVLRNFLRQRESLCGELASHPEARWQHPEWWLARLQATYPLDWPAIVDADNRLPPMSVRVNRRAGTCEQWMQLLEASGLAGEARGTSGVLLQRPVPVERLPGFADGKASIQDLGAQRAGELLAPVAGERILDACAAPGGKAAHLLEMADIDLLALDLKAPRCRRIEENFARLHLVGTVAVADCSRLDWWDGRPFDAVLADVPCTASGVVRRHPDAKWLRRESDIASFAAAQAGILDALWRVVRPGGKLLYATCSLFAEENGQQMERFLARTPAARRRCEEQWLPDAEHDGFYYCLLEKAA